MIVCVCVHLYECVCVCVPNDCVCVCACVNASTHDVNMCVAPVKVLCACCSGRVCEWRKEVILQIKGAGWWHYYLSGLLTRWLSKKNVFTAVNGFCSTAQLSGSTWWTFEECSTTSRVSCLAPLCLGALDLTLEVILCLLSCVCYLVFVCCEYVLCGSLCTSGAALAGCSCNWQSWVGSCCGVMGEWRGTWLCGQAVHILLALPVLLFPDCQWLWGVELN